MITNYNFDVQGIILLLKKQFQYVLICHEYREKYKERESCDMDILLYLPMEHLFLRKESYNPVDDEECESSTVECRKRQEIEYSEIDTDKRRDEEYDRNSDFGIQEIHEEISDSDRSSEGFDRFGPLKRSLGSNDFLHETSEKFQCHGGLAIGFQSSFFDRFEESVFIAEILANLDYIVSDIASDLPILGSHCDMTHSASSTNYKIKCSSRLFDFRDHLIGTIDGSSIDGEENVILKYP